MLGISRKNEIKKLITRQHNVIVSDLAKQFNITEETIRKDLKQLEDEGILKRIYGGAVLVESVQTDVDVNIRQEIMVKDKEIIADECIQFVNNHDSVFLDGSTTSYYIAKKIKNKSITVITNSLKIVTELSNSSTVKLVLIGGFFDSVSQTFLGKTATHDMKQYFVDKAFISCRSLHLNHGITDSNEQQAEIRKLAIEHAHNIFLVADHTKFNKTSFSLISELSAINTLITNRPLKEDWIQKLGEIDINYIYPGPSNI